METGEVPSLPNPPNPFKLNLVERAFSVIFSDRKSGNQPKWASGE